MGLSLKACGNCKHLVAQPLIDGRWCKKYPGIDVVWKIPCLWDQPQTSFPGMTANYSEWEFNGK
jgi:hypothetical protein